MFEFLFTDRQRSPLQQSRQSVAFTPYGFHRTVRQRLAILGFNGELREAITGHYVLGSSRLMNTVLYRFNSPDALSPFSTGGLNGYAYCSADPVNWRDDSGKSRFRIVTVEPPAAPRSSISLHDSGKHFEQRVHTHDGIISVNLHLDSFNRLTGSLEVPTMSGVWSLSFDFRSHASHSFTPATERWQRPTRDRVRDLVLDDMTRGQLPILGAALIEEGVGAHRTAVAQQNAAVRKPAPAG